MREVKITPEIKALALARGKRLKIARNMTGLPIREFSQRYDFGESTIKYWESGQARGVTPKGVKKVIEALAKEHIDCSEQWLLDGVGAYPRPMEIVFKPIDQIAEAKEPPGQSIEYLRSTEEEKKRFSQMPLNHMMITIQDNAMEPVYLKGDTLGAIQMPLDCLMKMVGVYCIVQLADDQFVCRQLARGSREGKYSLLSVNPQTSVNQPIIHDAEIKSLYQIVRLWRSWR